MSFNARLTLRPVRVMPLQDVAAKALFSTRPQATFSAVAACLHFPHFVTAVVRTTSTSHRSEPSSG